MPSSFPFSVEYAISILPALLKGLVVTVKVTLAGMALANGVGFLIAVIRQLGGKLAQRVFGASVVLIRNTPFLVFVLYMYYVLPTLGLTLKAFPLSVLIMGLYFGVFLAEVYRGGIQSVGRGQWEAGRVLGLSDWQVMRVVVAPQAIRASIPGVVNYLIGTFKDSSFLAWISLKEMMWHAKHEGALSYHYFEPYLMVTGLYLVISYPTSLLSRRVESRLRRLHGIQQVAEDDETTIR